MGSHFSKCLDSISLPVATKDLLLAAVKRDEEDLHKVVWVLYHNDNCGESLNGDGCCPKCHFWPDMQSTGFKPMAVATFALLRNGRTFTGIQGERLG